MATINVTLGVQVSGGPQIASAKQIEVEAYEKIEFGIGQDPKTKKNLDTPAPIDLGKNVTLLLIKSSLEVPVALEKPKLTYQVGGGKEIPLDAPHLYLGAGGVSVLGDKLTLVFKFTPADAPLNFVSIEILVGRDI